MNFVDPPIKVEIVPLMNKVQVFKGNDQYYVMYELKITNATNEIITLNSLLVQGQKTQLLISKLNDLYASISTTNLLVPENPILRANESGILFLQLKTHHPTNIQNILTINQQSIKCNPINISNKSPIIINHPLLGNQWLVINGFPNDGAHRRATFIINGNIVLPERFAVDLIQYGKDGLTKGDPYLNQNYYSYGNTIYSATDGVVVNKVDGIPDNIPGTSIANPTTKTIGGNFILVKTENLFVFYAHMIPNTIKVNIGDYVKIGQKIGLLGNSGGSQLPHLHFHVMENAQPIYGPYPSPINGQGVPWSLNHFTRLKYKKSGQSVINNGIPTQIYPIYKDNVKDQILMNNNLVNF